MFRIYVIGLIILLIAILLNVVACELNLTGRYDFINQLVAQGKNTFTSLCIIDII